ncbi:MAG: hypothetical protein ACREAG_02280 [Nitrosopumilaceae archaeon]
MFWNGPVTNFFARNGENYVITLLIATAAILILIALLPLKTWLKAGALAYVMLP